MLMGPREELALISLDGGDRFRANVIYALTKSRCSDLLGVLEVLSADVLPLLLLVFVLAMHASRGKKEKGASQ